MRHSPEVLRLLEKKLRGKGKPIPEWLIEAQKMPASCSVQAKLEKMGQNTAQKEKEAMERILKRNNSS